MSINELKTIALFGGSFNPVHYGHLRLAIEVFEALKPDRFDFIPCAIPPHKSGFALLPFALRVEMLREVCGEYPGFYVNPLEADREGASYTKDTLAEYKNSYPAADLYFVLGSEDYALLDTWKGWSIFPALATLLVVPRQGMEEAEFVEKTLRFWPQAEPMENLPIFARLGYNNCGQGQVLYMPLPRLDINASLVRRRFLDGRKIDFWVPPAVIRALHTQEEAVEKHWTA
ncbi:MAG: nicotinate (nicotinamide) nucleotide adenylyltransferase [Deltaproteobacteria bacterium]|nr:nicotinate (nicotinamide) nucleotide adenylyltransferase [Deltaproteobacteria bacterium]